VTPPAKRVSDADKRRAADIYRVLEARYPDAHCALDHRNAFQLLVATILSAQCTDERVNKVTPGLFKRFPTAREMSAADPAELESLIRSTGFYRNKAKALIASSRDIAAKFGGKVPDSMEALLSLRGVARKTANVVLGNAYGINAGVVVDTHVTRLSQRMGLSRQEDPVKIEADLMKLYARESWTMLSHLLIWHGRAVCQARKPRCEQCPLSSRCPKVGLQVPEGATPRRR